MTSEIKKHEARIALHVLKRVKKDLEEHMADVRKRMDVLIKAESFPSLMSSEEKALFEEILKGE